MRFFRKLYTTSMEDRQKIEAKITELNGGSKGAWDEAVDFQMMPSIRFNKLTNSYTIYADTGISVKVFINTETGETKMYWADVFMKAK